MARVQCVRGSGHSGQPVLTHRVVAGVIVGIAAHRPPTTRSFDIQMLCSSRCRHPVLDAPPSTLPSDSGTSQSTIRPERRPQPTCQRGAARLTNPSSAIPARPDDKPDRAIRAPRRDRPLRFPLATCHTAALRHATVRPCFPGPMTHPDSLGHTDGPGQDRPVRLTAAELSAPADMQSLRCTWPATPT